jgi:outer membrane protein
MRTRVAIIVMLSTTAALTTAQAQDVGHWIWRVGVHDIEPKSHNNDIVNVDSAYMLTFNGTYLFAPHWGVELLASLPFQHDVNLNGGGKVAEVKHLPPTLSLQYHFNPNGKWRPYVGAGLNYTVFFDESTTGALAGSDLKLDDSFGAAAQLGLDVELGGPWFANVDVRWFDIDSDAKVNGVSIGTVEIDPYAFGVSIGRRF